MVQDVYELAGMTLLVVEGDERVRSEVVLDLFYQGGRVLVAGAVDEALDVMRAERLDCVLASPEIAPDLRRRATGAEGVPLVPIVAMTPLTSFAEGSTIEA